MLVTGGFNAPLGCLDETARYVEGRFSVSADCTDNDEYHIQVCSDCELFLANISLRHKSDIDSLSPLPLHSFGVDQSRIADHSDR